MFKKLPSLTESSSLRYFAFFYLYAMQGIPAGFALTALANYLIGKGVNAVAIGTFDAIIGVPWILQFIWGPVIDRFQFSTLGRRRAWIIGPQLLTVIITGCLILVQDPVSQIGFISIIFVIHSVAASVQDAAVDATAIMVVPPQEMGRVNAFMRLGMLLGTAVGAAGFSIILHKYGFYVAAITQAALLLSLTIITAGIKVSSSDNYLPSLNFKIPQASSQNLSVDNPNMKWLFEELFKGILSKPSLNVFIRVCIVYTCTGTFIRALSFHLIHNLHWDDSELSVLQGTWGSVTSVVILLAGGLVVDRIGAVRAQKFIMAGIGLFLSFFGLIGSLWIHRSVSTTGIIIYGIADPLFSISSVPILMALCLPLVEGSQFTAYMAIVNLCDVIGAYLSGWAMTVTTGPVVGIICGAIIMLTLVFKVKQKSQFKTNGI